MRSKKSFLSNLFGLPEILFFLLNRLRIQKQFIKKEVNPEIEFVERNNDGSITPVDINKIINYYALGVPALLGEAFCVLRGNPFTQYERKSLSFLGGLTGLLDDLFDDPKKEVLHLEKFILNPEKLLPANSHEELLLRFYMLGLSSTSRKEELKLEAQKIFDAQKNSTAQQTNTVSCQEVYDLTWQKGGNSFIFYRLCFPDPLSPEEREFHYDLGGLMQLGNDIFDVWEDTKDNITTLATSTRRIENLRQLFTEEFKKCSSQLTKLDYPEQNKIRFLRIITLALARVYVCLDQFENLQKSTNNRFVPVKYERAQLICDMEKTRNQLSAIKYYLSFDLRSILS